MISNILRGQMANQMFQIATLYAHAKRNNVEWRVSNVSGKRDQFNMSFPHLPVLQGDEIFEGTYTEPKFGIYQPIPFVDNIKLRGYYQSALYFDDYREEILDLFNLYDELPVTEDCDWIMDGWVSIHQRRGDSLQNAHKLPQPTKKYLDDAIGYFPSHYKFAVFSDDMPYCKEIFKGERFRFIEGNSAKKDLLLMSLAEHNIIVNSTYSWWGAYMNNNPNKIIISPSTKSWFSEKYKDILSAQDIPCKDWIQIDY